MYQVEIFTSISGKSPFKTWFNKLDTATQVRIESRIDRLSYGNLGDCKPVGENIYELRLFFGPGYRVYYGKVGKRMILLLSGGDKSSQSKDITNAKKLFKEYLESKKNDE